MRYTVVNMGKSERTNNTAASIESKGQVLRRSRRLQSQGDNIPNKKLKTEKKEKKEIKTKYEKVQKETRNEIKEENDVKVKLEKTDICTNNVTTTQVNGSPSRTGLKYVGAHVSTAGGLHNAVTDAVSIGATSFALFLRSQRQWQCKPLEEDIITKFRSACKDNGFPPHLILPHGSYLLNLGSPNSETLRKSRELLIEELSRCEKLGLTLYNIHPGSSCGEISSAECIKLIAEGINLAHKKTKTTKVVLENMSKQGNTVGGELQQLRDIIDLVEDKSRIGVCLDTCHAFAAGYDLSTDEGFTTFLDTFNNIIGFNYLVAMHINDSKGKVGCHLDRHENIGKGHIGKSAFKYLMKCPRFNDIPLILETPWTEGVYKREIKLLCSMTK